jgi:hypothetical protein
MKLFFLALMVVGIHFGCLGGGFVLGQDSQVGGAGQLRVLGRADFLKAFRGVWVPPDVAQPHTFTGSYATHEQSADGVHVYLKCHPKDYRAYGVLRVPTPVITRDVRQVPRGELVEWREFGVPQKVVNKSGVHQYGFLETEKGIFLTFKSYYAVSGEDFPSQVFVDRDGKMFGCHSLSGAGVAGISDLYHHNKVAGYICRPPAWMKVDYLVGMCGTPGSRKTSAGPSLYGVTFDRGVPAGESQKASPILSYDPGRHAMQGWDNVTAVRGAAWIEHQGVGAVIFSARRSVGHVWYGMDEHTDTKTGVSYRDALNANKGYHAEGYRQGFWVMDPNELRRVYEGKIPPWSVKPREWIDLAELGVMVEGSNPVGWVTASYRDGRLILGVEGGYAGNSGSSRLPLMLEFRFGETVQ